MDFERNLATTSVVFFDIFSQVYISVINNFRFNFLCHLTNNEFFRDIITFHFFFFFKLLERFRSLILIIIQGTKMYYLSLENLDKLFL